MLEYVQKRTMILLLRYQCR